MALLQFNVQIRKHTMKTKFSCTRYLLHWPIRKLVNWGQSFLSKALLVTCEVAMEYMLALTYSPQVRFKPEYQISLHVWLQQLHITDSAMIDLPPPTRPSSLFQPSEPAHRLALYPPPLPPPASCPAPLPLSPPSVSNTY